MAREIVDAAVVQQFKTFLKEKDKDFNQLSAKEMKTESQNFIKAKYPGAKQPPNQMVELMTSPSAAKSLKNTALVNPEEKKNCTGTTNKRKKRSVACPDSTWYKNSLGDCLLYVQAAAIRDDAIQDCSSRSSQLLELVGTRAPVMYNDIANNKFSGFDKSRYFWLNTDKQINGHQWFSGASLSATYFGDVTQALNHADPLAVAMSAKFDSVKQAKFGLKASAGDSVKHIYFCQMATLNPKCMVVSANGAVSKCPTPTPTLPTFPCYNSTKSRKKRQTATPTPVANNDDDIPKNIKKLNLLLDPSKGKERKEALDNATKKYKEDFGQMDFKKAYESLFQILWYSQLPCFDVKDVTSDSPDQMSIIKKCTWKGKDISCPAIFKTLPTDRGMCCTFNMKKAEEIFRNSTYSKMVQSMQNSDESKR